MSKSSVDVGTSYYGSLVKAYAPGLFESNTLYPCQSISGNPGSTHNCEMTLPNEPLKLEELNLEFDLNTSDLVNFNLFWNLYLMLSYIKLSINNQEVAYHQDTEQIFSVVALYMKSLKENGYWTELQKMRSTVFGKTVAADSMSTGNLKISLPLMPVFYFMKNIPLYPGSGINRMSINFRFIPPYGSPGVACRYYGNATTTEGWVPTTKVTMTNLNIRLLTTRYGNVAQIPRYANPVMLIDRFETKQYSPVPFNNAGVDYGQINLFNDYTPTHARCMGILLYAYNPAAYAAYNSANPCQVTSNATAFRLQIKYGDRTLLDNSDVGSSRIRQIQYNLNTHEKRFGHLPLTAIETGTNYGAAADLSGSIWVPGLYIDLAGLELKEIESDVFPIGGISNSNASNYTIRVYCGSALGTAITLNAMLHYVQIGVVNGKGEVQVTP